MKFAQQIKSKRQSLGLTQAEAAALLAVSKRALEQWEAGERTPLPVAQEGALARLAKAKPIK
jgi:DNA-binding transcriptional regulator YiaG